MFQDLSGTSDSQRDSRESIRANHSQLKPLFILAHQADLPESPDSRESCESIRVNHATKSSGHLALRQGKSWGVLECSPVLSINGLKSFKFVSRSDLVLISFWMLTEPWIFYPISFYRRVSHFVVFQRKVAHLLRLESSPPPWTSLVRISVYNQVSDGNSY